MSDTVEPTVETQPDATLDIGPSQTAVKRPRSKQQEPRGVKGVLSRLRPNVGMTIPREIEDIVRLVKAQHPKADTRGIVESYELAQLAHTGQLRKSGEEFIEHPIGVARILAELGMDSITIIAAFLHDSVEDTDLTLDDVTTAFGEEVALIIDGLTKIEKIGFRSREQQRADNLRKMIVAMAKDLRVLIIKLADRLHNMRTVEALEAQKQELVATETIEIYAPLAHRLGMQHVKAELEDLSFKVLHPKVFAEIEQMVSLRQPERTDYLKTVIDDVHSTLRDLRIKADVSGRPKHYYSIYEKMVGRGREFDEIFDLVGVRIVVDNAKDCYAALGAIHAIWKPIPGRFKDYVAMPKFNFYQSLHTTVVGPEGKPLEIQIRTKDMHQMAEWGVASHWQYKEDPKGNADDEQAAWMQRMMELQQTEDDSEFLDTLRLDLFEDEVFVFTPKGEVVELQKGATPIDFAYTIHTEVGHACVGARVNGKLVPIAHQLSSGETVEVITSKTPSGPSRDWLDIVVTPRARTKIKQWFTKERREEAIIEGKDALLKASRRAGVPIQRLISDGSLSEFAVELKYANLESLYVALGEGRISAPTVIQRFLRDHELEVEDQVVVVPGRVRTKPRSTQGVLVKGIDEIWVKLARCCMPVPGDKIIGFITRGRGVSVHRVDCPNTKALTDDPQTGERFVEVTWDPKAVGVFPVSIQVEALDRSKLLRDVTTVISDFGINIQSATSVVGQGIAMLQFTFEITNPSQLGTILNMVRKVEAVYDVYRLTPRGR
ncbi:MAG: bifunctional (p)ppGpp synthetase/guanosine-3',5'-bis(diphosphate) 3'-pyrophosphohydrolase [Actinomycetota bacterium]|nr:bifunctional (p)ppGpp synthetase/guanosine-3',5'-bis(diphosphate) 3'-pyrophosphohydrolase [Actinomycetota bacterium]